MNLLAHVPANASPILEPEMNDALTSGKSHRDEREDSMAGGIGIGIALGAAIGVAMNDLAIGLGIGIALGVALGSIERRPQEPERMQQ